MRRLRDRFQGGGFAWACAAALVFTSCLTGVARGDVEQLLDRVPAGAQAVVIWRGFDEADPAFAESRFKAMLDDTGIVQRWGEVFGALIAQAGEDDPDAAEFAEAFNALGPAAWRRPWVAYFHGMDFTDVKIDQDHGARSGTPAFTMGFLIEPGGDAAALRPWFEKTLDEVVESDRDFASSEVALVDEDGVLGITTQKPGTTFEQSLPQDERFTEAVYRNGAAPRIAVYVDTAALLGTMRNAIMPDHPGEENDFDKTIAAFGFDGFGRLVWTGDFVEGDWVSENLVEAPAPRTKLASLLDVAPMDPAVLTWTTPAAQWARVARLDFAKAWDVILGGVREVMDKDDLAGLENGLAELHETLGCDLREDLLAHLGDTWLVYSDPSFAGMYGSGFVVVHELKDADKANETLLLLWDRLDAELEKNESPFRVQTLDMGEVKVHTLPFPMFSPSWAVADGRWLFGNSPAAVMTAVAAAREGGGKSIVDSPAYAHAQPWLVPDGGAAPTAVMVADLEKTVVPMYQTAAMWLGIASPQIEQETGVKLSGLLPPLGTILKQLHPAGEAAWVDDTGYHSRTRSPFPGATMLTPDVTKVSVASFGVGVTLPALGAARLAAQRAQSAANLRQICVGLVTYAADEKGRYPHNLATLVEKGYLPEDAEVLFAPTDDRREGESSYLLITPGVDFASFENPSGTIVVIERTGFGGGFSVAVGFADGHVERMPLHQVNPMLVEQTGRTLEQWNAAQGDVN